jgi:hypothetical protein
MKNSTILITPLEVYSEVGASEMPKISCQHQSGQKKHFHLRISNFMAVLKWMWHLALEAGKVFQTASM